MPRTIAANCLLPPPAPELESAWESVNRKIKRACAPFVSAQQDLQDARTDLARAQVHLAEVTSIPRSRRDAALGRGMERLAEATDYVMVCEEALERDEGTCAAALCDLGDTLYFRGRKDAAELCWSYLPQDQLPGSPAPLMPTLRPDPLWLAERFISQGGDPAAQALTQMHGAWATPEPGRTLTQAARKSEATAAPIYGRLALWELAKGLPTRAAETVALAGDQPASARVVAAIHFYNGNYPAALPLYAALAKTPVDVFQANFWASSALLALGQPAAATPYLQRAVANNPALTGHLVELGRNHMRLGDPEPALHVFLALLARRDEPACCSLPKLLTQAIAARGKSLGPLRPKLDLDRPFRAETAITALHYAMVTALVQSPETAVPLLGPLLAQNMDEPLLHRMMGHAWKRSFAGLPQPKAQRARTHAERRARQEILRDEPGRIRSPLRRSHSTPFSDPV